MMIVYDDIISYHIISHHITSHHITSSYQKLFLRVPEKMMASTRESKLVPSLASHLWLPNGPARSEHQRAAFCWPSQGPLVPASERHPCLCWCLYSTTRKIHEEWGRSLKFKGVVSFEQTWTNPYHNAIITWNHINWASRLWWVISPQLQATGEVHRVSTAISATINLVASNFLQYPCIVTALWTQAALIFMSLEASKDSPSWWKAAAGAS